MFQRVAGVVFGYLVYLILVFVTFTGLYLAVGTEVAFRPGSYDVSAVWVAASFPLILLASGLGGAACQKMAGCRKSVAILAGVVVVIGLLMAAPAFTIPAESSARPADVPNLQAMGQARTPAGVAALYPFVGAVGVLVGGKLARGRAVSG